MSALAAVAITTSLRRAAMASIAPGQAREWISTRVNRNF
jgi:hypothetical protein